jgi:hypothetical protein
MFLFQLIIYDITLLLIFFFDHYHCYSGLKITLNFELLSLSLRIYEAWKYFDPDNFLYQSIFCPEKAEGYDKVGRNVKK